MGRINSWRAAANGLTDGRRCQGMPSWRSVHELLKLVLRPRASHLRSPTISASFPSRKVPRENRGNPRQLLVVPTVVY